MTEVVGAKIDVAFHATVCGPRRRAPPPRVSQFTEHRRGRRQELCSPTIAAFTSIQMLAVHALIVHTFLFVSLLLCLFFPSSLLLHLLISTSSSPPSPFLARRNRRIGRSVLTESYLLKLKDFFFQVTCRCFLTH